MRHLGFVIVFVAIVVALFSPGTAPAVGEDLRALLSELLIQLPAREVSAPALSLPGTSGATVRLADYKGRPVMIYFWTTY